MWFFTRCRVIFYIFLFIMILLPDICTTALLAAIVSLVAMALLLYLIVEHDICSMHLTSASFADLQLYKFMRDMAIGKNSVTLFEPIDNISIKFFNFFLLSSKIYDPLFLHNLLNCCNLSDLLNIPFLVLSSSLILLGVSNIAKCSCLNQLLSVH